jgi:AcrR family transcriptional regulator
MTTSAPQHLVTDRRNQILDAAAELFVEKGFHPTTTKAIAKNAGVAEGTIYNYFECKTDLLLGLFDRMRSTVVQALPPENLNDLDLRAFMRLFLQQPLMAFRSDNLALFRIVVSEMLVNEKMRVRYYEQIFNPTLAIAEAYFQARPDQQGGHSAHVPLTIRAISGMVMGLMIEAILGDRPIIEAWDELPDFLTDLLFNGLKPESET